MRTNWLASNIWRYFLSILFAAENILEKKYPQSIQEPKRDPRCRDDHEHNDKVRSHCQARVSGVVGDDRVNGVIAVGIGAVAGVVHTGEDGIGRGVRQWLVNVQDLHGHSMEGLIGEDGQAVDQMHVHRGGGRDDGSGGGRHEHAPEENDDNEVAGAPMFHRSHCRPKCQVRRGAASNLTQTTIVKKKNFEIFLKHEKKSN